jgi:hypothetical protein
MRGVLLLTAILAVNARALTLEQILDRTAKVAEQEVELLSSVTCMETVSETKLNGKDKIENERKSTFDYFVLIDTSDGDISVSESRIEQGKPGKEGKPLLHSSGFALMMLVFHPLYQPSFQFTDEGAQADAGIEYRRIAFRYLPGKRSPTLLKVGEREYPLSWAGQALVEARTGRVRQVHAEVAAQLDEIGLKSLQVLVDYGMLPKRADSAAWVPLKAEIDLRTPHQHWHNLHSFGQFKKFGIDTRERIVVKPQ